MDYIGTLSLILIVTAVAGHISVRLGLPAVIGQLLSGIVLGPALLGWVTATSFISNFAELGVIILMFMAGLESDLQLLKKYWRPSLLVAVLGVILPVGVIDWCSRLFHLGNIESLFLGVTFAATSVSISVAVLKELHALDGKEGTTILGAAVVDDVLAVLILSLMISLFGGEVGESSSTNLGVSLAIQAAFFIGLFAVVKWVVPRLMKIGDALLVPTSVTLMSLVICFGLAYFADFIGLSAVIGAFFAGIAVGQTDYRQVIDAHIQPIGNAVFIPVFFVSIGLNMSFKGFLADFWFIVVITVAAIVTKLLGAGIGAKLAGFSWTSGYEIGAGMVSRGEMALIIAQIGYQGKLLSADRYSAVIAAIILTTLIAPILLRQSIQHQAKPAQKKA
ncbi:cation:proton antiporter [Lactiplantibacillus mudanjiangensis]|uniref:Na(+)/H(+) antiporter [Lactobacillus plantarum JDM1] n=1 Tax=Lactiplantibacillus mudanjiangensis TaxID=1296538 RepID=A0A660DVI2_9LACO|nr:cation:proton antiporter [Lactiplantibacillus mudanjiangensis]VDG20027.1 Na(+)/H(+) antiporter [Lactobacillus plantarum JDM1] [Lactiplantibacillus mudanjiangensis]VDG26188.1 Na(+)/H(+) antiporter [Lactobacillus plantarum JDM1] [Lactiplantibacillus mudanjiangensis]VDG27344.1 Na(+)/H(+) antiporter [Lactobacillus plantarum JDM1] [Lactiplantibacillus mudanjiangensis]